jgi:hypothetical protein
LGFLAPAVHRTIARAPKLMAWVRQLVENPEVTARPVAMEAREGLPRGIADAISGEFTSLREEVEQVRGVLRDVAVKPGESFSAMNRDTQAEQELLGAVVGRIAGQVARDRPGQESRSARRWATSSIA